MVQQTKPGRIRFLPDYLIDSDTWTLPLHFYKEEHMAEIDFSTTTEARSPIIRPSYKSKEGFIETPVLRGGLETNDLRIRLRSLEGFICGGYVRWMCSPTQNPKQASDVDVYAYTEKAFNDIMKHFSAAKLVVRYENENAITYVRPADISHKYYALPPIQLIKPIHEGAMIAVGNMETVIKNFDFTVIRAGLINRDLALVDADFEHDEQNSILRLKNIHCPISSTLRCMKYAAKGYWLPATQCIALFADWDNREEDYKTKILDFVKKAEAEGGLTQEDIDKFEKLARID